MAIRLELPPALFPRLNQGWQAACSYFQKQSVNLRLVTLRTVKMPVVCWHGLRVRYTTRWSLQARSDARRQREFQAFEAQYEELVDLLCWTAQEGMHPERNARYAELRQWMCIHYRKVRSQLRPYWVEPGVPEPLDPFEALFAAENVAAFINAPDSISDLMLTRAALDAYHEAMVPYPH
ncbi:MAG: hypothetical protein JWL77_3976 [Chthonomonadaceae bacterium]|nr:hypothetical protein [Chthonomonadaceae bacterium]